VPRSRMSLFAATHAPGVAFWHARGTVRAVKVEGEPSVPGLWWPGILLRRFAR
jgi:hypothetical protein